MTKDKTVIVALGDIVGRPGRKCLDEALEEVKAKYQPDILIGNGENLAGGFGITEKIFKRLTSHHGFDAITTGNHWADKKEIHIFGPRYRNLVLPGNMYNVDDPTRGCYVGTNQSGTFAVINLTCRVFMKGENDCPFLAVDQLLARIPASIKTIVVDIHGEATSEKQALAHYLDGRVSLVYGTHTHCPTADERILANKTGFVTDVGMTGAYDSVIGMRKEISIKSFLTGERQLQEPAKSGLKLFAIVATLDRTTGQCLAIERIRRDIC